MNQVNLDNSSLPNPIPFYYKAITGSKSFKDGDEFPEIQCSWKGFKFPKDVLKRYRSVCQIEGDSIPLLYPHSFLGPLHLQIMTHKNFPLKLLGSIHHRNHVIQYRPLEIDRAYDVFMKLGELRYRPQGLEFDLLTDIKDGSETVWASVTTILVRKKMKQESAESPLAKTVSNIDGDTQEVMEFKVPASTGKTFGFITKDINPIHMSSVLAKLFGFKRDLAHGMWALGRGSDPLIQKLDWQKPIRMDVAFKGPVYMKDQVRVLKSLSNEGQFEFYSGKNDRPSIVGIVKNVSPDEALF